MYSSGYYLVDSEFNVVSMNDTAKTIYPGLVVGEKCYKCLMSLDSPCPPCPIVNGIHGPRTYTDPIRHISEMVDAIEVPHETGLCHALVFSTVGEKADFAATLPTTASELADLALIKALTSNYEDVFSVNLATEKITLYRHRGKPVEANFVYKYDLSYVDGINSHIERFVHPDDKERLTKELSLANIKNNLKLHEQYTVHYRTNLNHYYFRRIVRIGDADKFEHFIVGVACEDEIVRSRELEINLGRIEIDGLTGLYNKEAFMLHGEEILKEYADKDYDLCILHFENLNLISHQQGDATAEKILHLIGKLLKNAEREDNCIAYVGNGYFASITKSYDEKQRRKDIFEFRNSILDLSPVKNISLKWSLYKAFDHSSLLDIFEKTMYALSSIRSSIHEDYVEFDKSIFERFEYEQIIEKDFDAALSRGEFVIKLQPKYSVKTGKISGAEALVRWNTANGKTVSPAMFIPVLERCGKINRLDTYVLEKCCEILSRMKSKGMELLPVSVNLSRASMFSENISGIFREITDKYNIDTKLLPIEITESAAVRASAIKQFAAEFVSKGFILHMDDFGSGYSSLASVTAIPFETIKLDKTLIDFIGRDSDESLLKHVISYAHEQGMSIVAEGVETYEQYLFLKVVGCDYIQGYYFAKPMDEDSFFELLKAES